MLGQQLCFSAQRRIRLRRSGRRPVVARDRLGVDAADAKGLLLALTLCLVAPERTGEAGVRPGNFVTIPDQTVDNDGFITVLSLADYTEEKMRINPPVDPLFRVGEIGLGYDAESDQVVLVAREMLAEDAQPEEANVVRFWCTRAQVRALARWGIEVAAQGRPNCPQCGEPMDPEGHFCPKKNGHKR